MSNLLQAAKALLAYIESHGIRDEWTVNQGFVDEWRSPEFQALLDGASTAVEQAETGMIQVGKRTYSYEPVHEPSDPEDTHWETVSFPTDLLRIWRVNPWMCRAYRITIHGQVVPAHALWVPVEDRLGIAWGAEATWADTKDLEAGIEMWLNDPDAWEAAQ